MENNEYKIEQFNAFYDYSSVGISNCLINLTKKEVMPVILCIGSDLVLGDSLGPLVGTLLKKRGVNSYVYGSLYNPVTAKEIPKVKNFLKKTHPKSIVLSIDAAVGEKDDVGLIKVFNRGVKPGLGVNKNLGEVGDVSIIGIVAEKTKDNKSLFNFTRLGLIYKMAEKISNGIIEYLNLLNPCHDKTHHLSKVIS